MLLIQFICQTTSQRDRHDVPSPTSERDSRPRTLEQGVLPERLRTTEGVHPSSTRGSAGAFPATCPQAEDTRDRRDEDKGEPLQGHIRSGAESRRDHCRCFDPFEGFCLMARTPRTFSSRGHAEAKAGENLGQGESRKDVTEKTMQTNQRERTSQVSLTR